VTERRLDPLTDEWRTFATHRQDRTFLPTVEHCPLCPTVAGRPPTEVPVPAFEVAVFDNRFPSFSATPPAPSLESTDLYSVAPAMGASEVVVFSDQHDKTFGDLDPERARLVIDVWAERYAELGARPEVDYVFMFENRGEAIGVTLSHPHGQIYGYPEVPPAARRELEAARRAGRCLSCAVVEVEQTDRLRLVATNASFVAHVPFAPRFPYEVHVVSREHRASLVDLDDDERDDLAAILALAARGYDRLWDSALPYVMSMHQRPTDGVDWDDVSHLHVEFTPIHRGPTKLKYLAGSEIGAGSFINDISPEVSAAALRRAFEEGA
jgi:UDPglucose--hexose-1-phosphate uridylyltransferase